MVVANDAFTCLGFMIVTNAVGEDYCRMCVDLLCICWLSTLFVDKTAFFLNLT